MAGHSRDDDTVASPGSAGARSAAEGQRGDSIDEPGSAGARSAAEGQRGDLIDEPGSAGARSAAEGQRGDSIDEPGSLEDHARAVQPRAYAPYSKFRVGAAIQMSGQIFEGVNVENASFPLSVCAERNAIAAAIAAGAHDLEAVVVITDASPPSAPCGGCRQVLMEFAKDPKAVTVTAINNRGERRSWRLADLLPDGFSGRELPCPEPRSGED